LLERKTGIKHVRYQVCENGCYCYAEKPDAETCPECGAPRPAEFKKKTFDFIDVVYLLRLQYSDAAVATRFQAYRSKLQAHNDGSIRDIWDGKLVEKIRAEGMLLENTDLAFLCSTVLLVRLSADGLG